MFGELQTVNYRLFLFTHKAWSLLRQRSQPRLVIGCALRLPDLAGGERPAVAPVAAVAVGRQRPELARRGVEPLLVPLGPLGPPWLGIGLGIGVVVGV